MAKQWVFEASFVEDSAQVERDIDLSLLIDLLADLLVEDYFRKHGGEAEGYQ